MINKWASPAPYSSSVPIQTYPVLANLHFYDKTLIYFARNRTRLGSDDTKYPGRRLLRPTVSSSAAAFDDVHEQVGAVDVELRLPVHHAERVKHSQI